VGEKTMILLDIGCGINKKEDFIGIDKIKTSCTDIVVDIEKEKLPFKDNSVDYIYCDNVLEHLSDIEFIMKEIYRVLKPLGVFEVIVPFFRNPFTYRPVHKLYFCCNSFDYWIKGNGDGRMVIDSIGRFINCFFGYKFYSAMPFWKLAEFVLRKFPRFYHHFFSIFFPARSMRWILRKEHNKNEL